MNKIAHYLNTHMIGEVVTQDSVRVAYARDGSPLTQAPEMVAFPASTSDIRKIARFSWQLAEKGHTLPLVARGAGTDVSGGATTKGMVVAMEAHMNTIFEYDPKQKLVRLQPGVTVNTLQNALALHGTGIEDLRWEHDNATLGGTIASSRLGIDYVDQLEVVLSNGDVLQTRRLSKKELAKAKAKPGLEGDIYRALDTLIEENVDLINGLAPNDDRLEHSGYASIELVKERDGSFDLTPLLVGTQGTLGIISEMILKADFLNQSPALLVASFASHAQAHDALETLLDLDPSTMQYVDGSYLDAAEKAGKTFGFYHEALEELGMLAATVIVEFNDFSERARKKKMKKALHLMKPFSPYLSTTDDLLNSDLRSLQSVTYWMLNPDSAELSAPPLLDGVYVGLDRFDDFSRALTELAKKHSVELSLYGRPLDETWYVRPTLRLGTVGDKQKLFKLAQDLADLVKKYGGTPFGAGGDGRLGSSIHTDDREAIEFYQKVRAIFDLSGILNPTAKKQNDARELAKQLGNSYHPPAATNHLSKY